MSHNCIVDKILQLLLNSSEIGFLKLVADYLIFLLGLLSFFYET